MPETKFALDFVPHFSGDGLHKLIAENQTPCSNCNCIIVPYTNKGARLIKKLLQMYLEGTIVKDLELKNIENDIY